MATPTRPRDRNNVLHKVLANLLYGQSVSLKAGHAGQIGYLRKKLWVASDTPSGAAPSGMLAKDIILDTGNNKVYRYITGTTYVDITATS